MAGSTVGRHLPARLITVPALLAAVAMTACTAADATSGEVAMIPADSGQDHRVDRRPSARACMPPSGISARPRSIAETVELVNALPRPVTVACFLESLERPLYLNATKSFISLQPAVGLRSPRLFLMFEGMSLSVVPEGSGSKLIEFGEFVSPERTLKAELGTPITAPVQPGDPFRSPISTAPTSNPTRGTTCRTCHGQEERAEEIPFAEAFHSLALRPAPRTIVTLETVRAERNACPDEDTGERCAILRALLDHGEVLPRDFPDALPTIFD